jgi:hypothetical protein
VPIGVPREGGRCLGRSVAVDRKGNAYAHFLEAGQSTGRRPDPCAEAPAGRRAGRRRRVHPIDATPALGRFPDIGETSDAYRDPIRRVYHADRGALGPVSRDRVPDTSVDRPPWWETFLARRQRAVRLIAYLGDRSCSLTGARFRWTTSGRSPPSPGTSIRCTSIRRSRGAQ